jgi:hypothetical protein
MEQFERCEHCGHLITGPRIISLYKGLLTALFDVFKWCEEKGKHEFEMAEVKHFLGKNEYARFGDLVMFSGLVYKRGKGNYGLHMVRCGAFFSGDEPITIEVEKDPRTGLITPKRFAKINQIPSLVSFLDENWRFVAKYRKPLAPYVRTESVNQQLPI